MARREFDPDAPYKALEFTLKRYPDLVPTQGQIVLLHPRAHAILKVFDPARTICLTPERRDVERLEQRGYRCVTSVTPHTALPHGECALCLVFPGESKDEALYLLALGASTLCAGGRLIVAMSNDLGAARYEDRVGELLGAVDSQSKHHCRVFWGTKGPEVAACSADWLASGELRTITGSTLKTLPGLFSWNKIDQGSKLLGQHLPALTGKVADLGCGYGYLSVEALSRSAEIAELALFDSDYRAIETSRLNLAPLTSRTPRITFHWEDIQSEPSVAGFDFIVMNPPFHEYGTLRVELGRRFFATAAQMLRPGGTLFAVVNRHLPYDETLWGLFPTVEEVVVANGYRVIRAKVG